MKNDKKFLVKLELDNYLMHVDCYSWYSYLDEVELCYDAEKGLAYSADEYEYSLENIYEDYMIMLDDVRHKIQWVLGDTCLLRYYGMSEIWQPSKNYHNPNIELYNPDFYKFLVTKGIY